MFHLRPLFVEHFVCCTKYLMSSSALSAVLGGGGGVNLYLVNLGQIVLENAKHMKL